MPKYLRKCDKCGTEIERSQAYGPVTCFACKKKSRDIYSVKYNDLQFRKAIHRKKLQRLKRDDAKFTIDTTVK